MTTTTYPITESKHLAERVRRRLDNDDVAGADVPMDQRLVERAAALIADADMTKSRDMFYELVDRGEHRPYDAESS